MNKDKEKNNALPTALSDQQDAQLVKQAIKDDQGLSEIAKDIQVTVKEGTVTLEGKVANKKQMNLVTNTASAVAVDDKVKTNIEVRKSNS